MSGYLKCWCIFWVCIFGLTWENVYVNITAGVAIVAICFSKEGKDDNS